MFGRYFIKEMENILGTKFDTFPMCSGNILKRARRSHYLELLNLQGWNDSNALGNPRF